MSVPLDYKDTVSIVKTSLGSGGYATRVIDEIIEVPALFLANTGWAHGGNQAAVTSDAQVYLDPENEFVLNNYMRLEGMRLIYNKFGEDEEDSWYLIESVIIGEDKLLGNQVDNVQCTLKKTTAVDYVS